jgi:protein disulfide-isomerase
MKKITLFLLILIGSFTSQAQEGLTWYDNINKAIEVSKEEQKPLMLFFTGSDWCGWCHRLQAEVFNTPDFTTWAKGKVVLVELDFPRRKQLPAEIQRQNMELQQLFQPRGYPTVYIVKPTDIDGKTNFEPLGQTGYVAGGPSKWLEGANQMIAKFVPDPKPEKTTKKTKKAKKKKAKA